MSGQQYDDPNREAVGVEPAWEEGEGGPPGEPPPPPEGSTDPQAEETNPLDSMTKDELLDEADARGVEVPSGATKAEIREAIDEAEEG